MCRVFFEIGQLTPVKWVKCPPENTKHRQNTPSNDISYRDTGPNKRIHIEDHVLLSLLNELRKKEIKCEAAEHFISLTQRV